METSIFATIFINFYLSFEKNYIVWKLLQVFKASVTNGNPLITEFEKNYIVWKLC